MHYATMKTMTITGNKEGVNAWRLQKKQAENTFLSSAYQNLDGFQTFPAFPCDVSNILMPMSVRQ
jgi:hypothetical protein